MLGGEVGVFGGGGKLPPAPPPLDRTLGKMCGVSLNWHLVKQRI